MPSAETPRFSLDFSWISKARMHLSPISLIIVAAACLSVLGVGVYWSVRMQRQAQAELEQQRQEYASLEASYQAVREEYQNLLGEDQYLRNERLQATISAIENTYDQAVKRYENIVDLGNTRSKEIDSLFAQVLSYLSQRNYASSQAVLGNLDAAITAFQASRIATTVVPDLSGLPAATTPPDSGYARQAVDTSIGRYQVSIVSADLNSTKVIVDTASASDCTNDCPVLPLASYISRNGAFAGINGSYFCPASYPSCAGRTNTFDTLLMNKDKVYFNSDNNVYSTVPAVIFSGNSARFVGQSLEWGRDTGVDAVLANQPLLVSNGNVVFGGDGDPKKGSKGNRSFVGSSGNMAYIGVVHNATVAEAAIVLQALGIQNALNLDSGGSTALWSDGYKAGPGRDIPNALLFVRK